MSTLFGVDIASEVNSALSGQLLDATLTREDPGTYDPVTDTYSGGGADSTYSTEGVVETYRTELVADGAVQANDRKITLLADPLSVVPSPGTDNRDPDTITIDGETFTVISVERDPAGATYIIQGRR